MLRAIFCGLLLLVPLLGCQDSGPTAEAAPPPIGNQKGNRPPPLSGVLPGGEEFRLDREPERSTVVVLYRGTFCGLCRERLRSLAEHAAAYEAAGARVIAVTLDDPAETAEAVRMLGLPFPILSTDSATFARWGAWPPDRAAPLPASFLVDGDGVIRYRHVGRNAADRASDAALLAALRQATSE